MAEPTRRVVDFESADPESAMAIATASGLVGIAVYFASNHAFSMLSLGDQYATATTDVQRSMLLAVGEGLLAINNPGAINGSMVPPAGDQVPDLPVTAGSDIMAIVNVRWGGMMR
jgi:hypothetical protein